LTAEGARGITVVLGFAQRLGLSEELVLDNFYLPP
jgi:hypothetical protein